MQYTSCPIRLWNYFFLFATMIRSVMVSFKIGMTRRTIFEVGRGAPLTY